MRSWTCWVALAISFTLGSASHAGLISINFNNTESAAWVIGPGVAAGPLDSINWNNTSTASGSGVSLVDDDGNLTGAVLSWNSSNTWTNGDLNGYADRRLLHPYLDDGNGGLEVVIENIPYLRYRVYGVLSSGQNGNLSTYTTRDFSVNGSAVLGGNASAAGDYDYAQNNFGSDPWRQVTTDQIGNYWLSDELNGDLTIEGLGRSGSSRGSLAGIVIESVPEPGTGTVLCMAILMGTAGIRRRRQK
ncbi:hypothetical protein SV7mr_24820 [Stieleria bergensis]|uniref:PEP-CTERM protein-sorting domain-containing protein n=1 Tax=Stieleria bergensis TaxID=2528025 RepID=A0A517SV36_9BACT|nr:hypothetical protein SV7mr_24820 [Planctomycetes bacterium SV_7m_r]